MPRKKKGFLFKKGVGGGVKGWRKEESPGANTKREKGPIHCLKTPRKPKETFVAAHSQMSERGIEKGRKNPFCEYPVPSPLCLLLLLFLFGFSLPPIMTRPRMCPTVPAHGSNTVPIVHSVWAESRLRPKPEGKEEKGKMGRVKMRRKERQTFDEDATSFCLGRANIECPLTKNIVYWFFCGKNTPLPLLWWIPNMTWRRRRAGASYAHRPRGLFLRRRRRRSEESPPPQLNKMRDEMTLLPPPPSQKWRLGE